jgi:hypothetical protein
MSKNKNPEEQDGLRVVLLDRELGHDVPIHWWSAYEMTGGEILIKLGYLYGWFLCSRFEDEVLLVSRTKSKRWQPGEMIFIRPIKPRCETTIHGERCILHEIVDVDAD